MSTLTTRMQKHASENVQGDDDDLSETLSDTVAHNPCEYDEDGFESETLVSNAEGSSSSMAGEVVETSEVGVDDVSVSKLRQARAQRSASVHEARVRATSALSTPILHATIFFVEHEGACCLSVGKTPPQVQPNPVTSVLGRRLVVADTSAQMIRRIGPLRHHMPLWCLDLQRAQESNNFDGQVSTNQCVGCEVSLGAVVADSDVCCCKQCANDCLFNVCTENRWRFAAAELAWIRTLLLP